MSKPECHIHTDDPADQPKPPVGSDKCDPIPPTKPPHWDKPEKCKIDEYCNCPDTPSSDPNCLEKMISDKASALAAAEKDKVFKADLEALLGKANTAKGEYTVDKYEKLGKQWAEQDEQIAELIRKLVCALPCWRCVIECYVCPFVNRMVEAEARLKWDPKNYPKAFNHYDLLHWHTRDKVVKEARFNRIRSVLVAWEKPAQSIDKNLTDNAKLIADANKALGTEPSKVAFDVFMKLVPMHLAIAPPEANKKGWETCIDKKYTKFCECDMSCPDDCCGPDVGEFSIRQRLVGPQAYLIHPDQYLPLICCIVEKRYGPAQKQLTDAEGEVLKIEAAIKSDKDAIDNGLKNFDKEAKNAIPTDVLCCDNVLDQPTQDQPPQAS